MGSSYLQLYFHFVWSTYKRLPWIDDEIELHLESLIRERIIIKKIRIDGFWMH
jgi:hypothetical protein